MMKKENYYGVELTPVQGMYFSKYMAINGIAMNTIPAEKRADIVRKWLKEFGLNIKD